MRRILKRIGYAAACIVGLVGVLMTSAFAVGKSRMAETYAAPSAVTRVALDAATIEQGEHVMQIHMCQECHGDHLEGKVFADIPPGRIVAPNLTSGKGGVGAEYGDGDWDRAVRYGVRPDGKALLPFMPYTLFHQIGDEDMAALSAYLESLAPVDNDPGRSKIRLPGYLMLATPDFSPGKRRRALETSPPKIPPVAATAEYGAYLVSSSCVECHGAQLRGGTHPAPDAPPGPDLSALGDWPFEAFAATMRAGVTPDGRQLRGEYMPYRFLANMTDVELQAIQAHLRTLR